MIDLGAFALGQFGGRQTDAGRASDHDDFLTCKLHSHSPEGFMSRSVG